MPGCAVALGPICADGPRIWGSASAVKWTSRSTVRPDIAIQVFRWFSEEDGRNTWIALLHAKSYLIECYDIKFPDHNSPESPKT
jgi:hypothetical protein